MKSSMFIAPLQRLFPGDYSSIYKITYKPISGVFPKYKNFDTIRSCSFFSTVTGVSQDLQLQSNEQEMSSAKPGHWTVVAYATAPNYDIKNLKEAVVKQGIYIPSELIPADPTEGGSSTSLFTVAKYKVTPEERCIFYFPEGSLVMWNIEKAEQTDVLNFVKPFESKSYKTSIVRNESESMSYTYSPLSKRSHIHEGVIHIASAENERNKIYLDMYTFSNSMALSVKLGVYESCLEEYIKGIEFVTEDLKAGERMRITRREVIRKSGELFALRHAINLSTDLLDTPDFYWDRDNLEVLYQRACSYFSISRRTKVLNEKLNHCIELMELVSTLLNDRHHVRLEWMIIILIMVEVAFEIVHYLKT